MSGKILIVLVAIALIIAGIYFLAQQPVPESKAVSVPELDELENIANASANIPETNWTALIPEENIS